MGKRKKLNKLKVGILIFLIVLILSISVFGRYIYNAAIEGYFLARQFYFSSDILTVGGESQIYTYDSWGGVDQFEFALNLYSYNNELSKVNYDLGYTITCYPVESDGSSEKITCSISGTNGATTSTGTIFATTNASRVGIQVNPKPGVEIEEGDTVHLIVTASTTEPYQKTISRKIALHINLPEGNSYSIEDVTGRDYAILKLLNRLESATQVTLEFDPNEVRLDMNDEIYTDTANRIEVGTTTISGNTYINKIVFGIQAESAKNVKFYKVDKSEDYSYPKVGSTSVISVNY